MYLYMHILEQTILHKNRHQIYMRAVAGYLGYLLDHERTNNSRNEHLCFLANAEELSQFKEQTHVILRNSEENKSPSILP